MFLNASHKFRESRELYVCHGVLSLFSNLDLCECSVRAIVK